MATMVELSPTGEQNDYVLGKPADKKTPPQRVPGLCSVRYGIAFITHFCNFTLLAQNAIISITMVAMVNSTDHAPHLNGSSEELPAGLNGAKHEEASKHLSVKAPVYNWSPQTQGIIFSSVQYGMVLMQGPGGYLAGKIGTKKLVGIALIGSSLLTLCIPLAANLGLAYLLATRAIQGLTQGTGYGGQLALWQRWAPPNERGRLCSIALSGMILGIFTVLLVGGIISNSLGWPFVFYIFGGIGVVCWILWLILVYDDPVSHPWISDPEKEYILSSLDHQNGFLSSLPFLVAWTIGILGGQLADFLLSKNFSVVTVRKTVTTLGTIPPATLVVALPYVRSSFITTVTFLTLACGICPLSQPGVYINALDIAPRYASFLMGTSRGFAHSSAVLVPIVGGFFLNQDSEFGWRNFFFLSFAISLFGLILFLVFGKADVQEWAKERKVTRL
ncbi:sodium-dependent phosphate transport protein 4 isoform X2 [Psammomys obesus]|uniref:sodium-dependent phosphate transport protein 4 isoform X2 n=1 Tax=Psammomys obesus TaxID=48139 RepID=UPI002452D559|nr:sodium-dependent phosphate transport protein 4 isoform X2 [Psammomys obesus]